MTPEILKPVKFSIEDKKLATGRYLVIRKDGKCHTEMYNGTGWAYNHKAIEYYYLPKI